MDTSSWFRLAVTAIVLGVFSLAAVAADTSKVLGNDKDKDKKDSSSHNNSERSFSSKTSTSDSQKPSGGNRDNSNNRAIPAPAPMPSGNGNPSASPTIVRGPASVQPQPFGNAAANSNDWRNNWDRDSDDRDRWEREQEDRYRWEVENQRIANGNFNGVNRMFSGTATFVGTNQNVMLVSAGDTIYRVRADNGAKIEVTGTAGPDFLKTPGLVVKFQGPFDFNGATKNKAIKGIGVLTSLETVITPNPGDLMSENVVAADNGGGNAAGNIAKPNAALPTTARTIAVVGKVKSYVNHELTVLTDNHTFTVDLDPAPVIKVQASDIKFARPGDQVDLTGYFVRPGIVTANRVSIKLAKPLGDPLSELVKQKPAATRVKPAGDKG
jgi:hypothetical protein